MTMSDRNKTRQQPLDQQTGSLTSRQSPATPEPTRVPGVVTHMAGA